MTWEEESSESNEQPSPVPKKQKTICNGQDTGTTGSLVSERKMFDISILPTPKIKGQSREFNWKNASFGQFLLKITYLGTRYSGLAWQPPTLLAPNPVPTVEGKLFEAMKKTCLIKDRKSCHFSRCGRTDKGVHAAGNYISVRLRLKPESEDSGIDECYDYPTLLNSVLPNDIRVVDYRRVPEHFDARFQCLYRVYKYLFVSQGMDVEKMLTASQQFVGLHDFRNFCKIDADRARHFHRKILWIKFRCLNGSDLWEVEVAGVSFLWHQIRSMMAILFLIGKELEEPAIIPKMLDTKLTPAKPGYELADHAGLILFECFFEGVSFAKDQLQLQRLQALRSMYLEHLQMGAVLRCLTMSDVSGCGVEEHLDQTMVASARLPPAKKYIPLLERETGYRLNNGN